MRKAISGKITNKFEKEKKIWMQHATCSEIKKYYASKEQWDSYFKFAIIRNPFDRIVSSYNWLCGSMMKPCNFRDRLLFKNFVFRKAPFKEVLSQDFIGDPTNRYHHIKPSIEYLFENDNLLVDYVGRFENLEYEWKFICKKIGTKNTLPHIHKRSRSNKHYREYYNDETRGYISEVYKKDLEIFGYKF
jgi:hypothetical protein